MQLQVDLLLNPVSILVSIVSLGSIAILIPYFMFYYNKNLTCYIIAPIGDAWKLIAKKRMPMSAEKFDYKGKTYLIDLKKTAYFSGSKAHLFYRLDQATPIFFADSKVAKSADAYNMIAGKISIIREILRGLSGKDPSELFIYLLLGVAIGFIAGAILAPYLFPAGKQIAQQTTTTATQITVKP